MKVVILTWNPANSDFKIEDFRKARDEYESYEGCSLHWKVSILGDWDEESNRFFLIRMEQGKADIVMSGGIESAYYENDDSFAELDPDYIVNPETTFLDSSVLNEELPGYDWNNIVNGTELEKWEGSKLMRLWFSVLFAKDPESMPVFWDS